jgi:branched-chain amino acid transport system permease protein
MDTFIQQVVSGVMTGSVYGVVALSLVMIFQSTRMFNFGQGEIATFTTFIAWSLMLHMPYAAGFVLAVVVAFGIGAVLERGLIRLVEDKPPMSGVMVGLGLFIAFNSLSASIYGPEPHQFTQPFVGGPMDIAGVTIGRHSVYLFGVAMLLSGLLYVLFQYTRLGLSLRATAADRNGAELMGIPTGRMLMLGWGLATAVGAVAGMLVAPVIVLTPNMMFFVLVFGFSAAVLGGLDSAPGAIVGGLLVGVTQNLVGVYIDNVVGWLHLGLSIKDPNQYRDIVAIGLIVVVLAIRPRGIFGRPLVERV